MSLLHKAITLSGACAIGLTLAFAAPAAAEDAKPINFRAVGGAVLGGTWNVGLTGVGKLVNDRYPGSAINVLQGVTYPANNMSFTVNQPEIPASGYDKKF